MSKKVFTKGTHNVPEFYVKMGSELLNAQINEGKGIPSGVIMQIQSEGEGASKSTEAWKMLAEVQRMGKEVAYVDGENRILLEEHDGRKYNKWLNNLGVDVNNVYFVPVMSGEETWEAIIDLVTDYKVQFVVLDSIHSVRPSVDYDNSVGDKSIGQHAALHQKGILKLSPLLSKHKAILCGINQRRDNVTKQGKMGTNASGGASWRFYSSYNFIFKKGGSNRSFDGKDYIPLDIFIDKNSGGKAYQTIKTFVKQGDGIDKGAELAVIATELGLIRKAGSWWKDKEGNSIGQGDMARFIWAEANVDEILSLYNPETKEETEDEN